MNDPAIHPSWMRVSVLILAAVLLSPFRAPCSEDAREFFPVVLPPPSQDDQSVFRRRLETARRDLEAFRLFAEAFRKKGETGPLAQLQGPVDEFMKKHVNSLLVQEDHPPTLETGRLAAEIMFIKARLLMLLDRRDSAGETVAGMKKRFVAYPGISVELPGKTTTLDDGIRELEEELGTESSKK